MTTDEALHFLESHQPLPPTREISEKLLRQFDEVRKRFEEHPDNRSIPLLNSFGEGDGHGVYQLLLVQYVYDGNLVIQERHFNPQISAVVPQRIITYTRGQDLSGTLQGAGGIGGLLARSDRQPALEAEGTHAYFHAEGNGNVTALTDADAEVAAKYLFDPFGNILRQSGPLAEANLYRFSSKEFHAESGLVYYGYRFYEPNLQRWIDRDPIGEWFDRNLYRFNYNNPINFADQNGLWAIQFGDFNIGWGDPNLAFDSDSWMDLSNGAAATADGLIPFGDPFADLYQHGDIWSDDSEGLSAYDRSLYDKSKTGGRIAQVCLTTAAGAGLWNAARLPTMSIGGAMPPAGGYTPHFFWSVTTRSGTTKLHSLGRSTTVGAEFWGGYLGGPSSITRIPIFFPRAAAALGVTSRNCLTGMCGAVRRGVIGF